MKIMCRTGTKVLHPIDEKAGNVVPFPEVPSV